jgi:transcriptional regulator with XRE-family HTH domain
VPEFCFSGDRLRETRVAARHGRAELAVKVGRSESLITLYELGYRQPPADMVVALAEALGADVRDFFVVGVLV